MGENQLPHQSVPKTGAVLRHVMMPSYLEK
jgi:hypothetical protein